MLPSIYEKTNTPVPMQAIKVLAGDCWKSAPEVKNDSYFEVLWIVKGRGTCWLDLQELEISDNSIFCLSSDQSYLLQACENLTAYSIMFTASMFQSAAQEEEWAQPSAMIRLVAGSSGILQKDTTGELSEIMKQMIREFHNDHFFRIELLNKYARLCLVYIARQFEHRFQQVVQTRNIEMTRSFKLLVDKNFIARKLVAEYAAMLCVTPNYLNTVIKKMTGYSARDHIRQRTVMEAKRKAAYSSMCMKEVAYHLGFVDTSHFSKYFKNATGINFSDFKKARYMTTLPGTLTFRQV